MDYNLVDFSFLIISLLMVFGIVSYIVEDGEYSAEEENLFRTSNDNLTVNGNCHANKSHTCIPVNYQV